MTAKGRLTGIAAGALLTALLISLSGCGSGGDGSATASEPLTKAQFIKRASAICASEESRKQSKLKAASKLGENYFGGPKQELTQLVSKVVLPLYKELIEEMSTLSPPAGEEAEVKRIIEKYEKTLKKAEADPGKEVYVDSFVKTNLAAEKYGIKNCTL
jgi:hypothetical protein